MSLPTYGKEQYALDVALIGAAVGISSSSSFSIISTIIKYSSSSRMLLFPALIQSQAIKIYSQIPITQELSSLSLSLSLPRISRFLNRRIRKGAIDRGKGGTNV